MFDDLCKAYIAAALDLAETTRQTYTMGLRAFGRFLNDKPYKDDPRQYPIDILAAFRLWLLETYNPRTCNAYHAAAENLLRWLGMRGVLANDSAYARMVQRYKDSKSRAHNGSYVARPIDPDIHKLLTYYVDMPLPKTYKRRLLVLRNRALVAFLYDTAARINEALALTRADVGDGKLDKVILYKTKGDKPRTVFLSEDTRRLIHEYTAARADSLSAPLFLSHGRNHDRVHGLSAHQAWGIIKAAAKAEGLLKNTSPHCLRHARAQDLLDAGMPLEWITALLGHESPGTTRNVYAPHVNTARLGALLEEYGKTPTEWAKEK